MDNKKRCYNSGKIGGLPYLKALNNFRKADEAIKNMGFVPVNPMYNGINPSYPWIIHMVVDILLLATCGNIYFQSNWESSRGSGIEFKIAKFLRMEIWFENKE